MFDEISYQDSWLIAENLDHNLLAVAFRKFPVSADPVYTRHQGVVGKDELSSFSSLEFSDSEEEEEEGSRYEREEEEEEEGSRYEEEEEVEVSSEVTQSYDGGGDEDIDVSNLRDSGELT